MPYNKDTDQFYWGYSPKADGSDYDPSRQSPHLSDAYRVLSRHVKDPINTRLQIAVVGKIHYSANGNVIDGYTGNISFESFESIATSVGLTGKAVKHGGGGFSTEKKIGTLLSLDNIEKITGVYFRILD